MVRWVVRWGGLMLRRRRGGCWGKGGRGGRPVVWRVRWRCDADASVRLWCAIRRSIPHTSSPLSSANSTHTHAHTYVHTLASRASRRAEAAPAANPRTAVRAVAEEEEEDESILCLIDVGGLWVSVFWF